MTRVWSAVAVFAIGIVITAVFAASVDAQSRRVVPSRVAWVGLFNDDLVNWLENENRLAILCPHKNDAVRHDACVAEMREPKLVVVPARQVPRDDAPDVGQIVIAALPGRGLRTYVATARSSTAFTPDLHDIDWGYGPWWHQTVLDVHETWVRLPMPVLGAVWVNTRSWTLAPAVHTLAPGDIITIPGGDMVVVAIEDGTLRVRAEQPADMWCAPGDPPLPQPSKTVSLRFSDLTDADGHLRIAVKYTRGC